MADKQPISTIIIDDEEASRETLRNYVGKYCPDLHVVAECKNIHEAKKNIAQHAPQLIFLDVEMPFGNAFDLLEQVDINFEIIFVTAYSQYALQALNHSASYYILKPIDIEELEKAVEKIKQTLYDQQTQTEHIQTRTLLENIKLTTDKDKKVVLPLLDGFEVVAVGDIIRCVANGNFTDFYLKDGTKKMICRTLKFYAETLSKVGFMRVHRSHLINLSYLKSYNQGKGGQAIMVDGSIVDVSPSMKKELIDFFS